MPLDTPGLKADIMTALTDMESRNSDSKSDLAGALANAFEKFVKSGDLPIGLAVATPAGAGSTSAIGKII